MGPKIAIVGGGPAGLTLGAILQKSNIPFIIYDTDNSPHERNQGGTLDLHPSGGQAALRKAGLWQEFVQHARPEADVLKIVDLNGDVLWDGNTKDKQEVPEDSQFDHRPEIDRAALKEVLLGGIDPEAIKWGKHLQLACQNDESGKYDLHFGDGTIEKDIDLLVGADGAWSKVRKLVSDVTPEYSGITTIECWALDVNENRTWMSSYVGAGSLFSFGEGRAIQVQRMGDGSFRSYASLCKPETFLRDCKLDWAANPKLAKEQFVSRYFDDCGTDLKRAILESNDTVIPRTLYQLPVGVKWNSRPGVTLLGDAAHLMTPFAGVGVNAAMMDSLSLAEAIIASLAEGNGKNLAHAVKDYETIMFPRGEMFAQKTMGNIKKHFGAGGSQDMANRLIAHYRKSE